jgi:hypothetical protein
MTSEHFPLRGGTANPEWLEHYLLRILQQLRMGMPISFAVAVVNLKMIFHFSSSRLTPTRA